MSRYNGDLFRLSISRMVRLKCGNMGFARTVADRCFSHIRRVKTTKTLHGDMMLKLKKCEGLRSAYYTNKEVRCPNVPVGIGRYIARPGDIITWKMTAVDETPIYFSGRMFARVSAPAESERVPAIKGYLAVLELKETFDGAYVRFVDPKDVTSVRECPQDFPKWFFRETLPGVDELLRLSGIGALYEPYIERYKKE